MARPFDGHFSAADVVALDGPEALGDGGEALRREELHQGRAPVAVGGVAPLRNRVAHAEDVERRLRAGIVEVEPEPSAAALKVLGVDLHVRPAGARSVEGRRERFGIHLHRAVVPRQEKEAPLGVRGVVWRERDLPALCEGRRRGEPEREAHRVVDYLAGRPDVESLQAEAARLREYRRAVRHEDGGAEIHGIVADVGELGRLPFREAHGLARERRRRAPALGPVAGRGESAVRRTAPHGIRRVRARRRAGILHPELDAPDAVSVRGKGRPVLASGRGVGERALERLARAEAEVTVVRESSDAYRVRAAARAPVVPREEYFAAGERALLGELAHDLEARMRPGRTERVVEPEFAAPRICNGSGRRLVGAAVVEGRELDEPGDGIVVGGNGLHCPRIAPDMEFRHGGFLLLRGRDGHYHVVERASGGVHVDPEREMVARKRMDEIHVVAGLFDAGLGCRRSERIPRAVRAVGVMLVDGGFESPHVHEAVAIGGGDVRLGAENRCGLRPGAGRILAGGSREREELSLERGGGGFAFGRRLRRSDEPRDVNRLDAVFACAP